jgi:hypothetical protein
MSLIVKAGENRDYFISNKNIKGIKFNVVLEANAVNVAFHPSDWDASKVFVSIDLSRNGRNIKLYSDNLGAMIANSYRTNYVLLAPTNSSVDNIVCAAGASAKQKQILNYMFGMPDWLNKGWALHGSDEIKVSVQFTQAAQTGTNLINSTTSYIDIVEDIDECIEHVTPILKTMTIKAGESKMNIQLGDGVMSCYLLNYDKNDILLASSPWTVISLTSEEITYVMTDEQMFGLRQTILQGCTSGEQAGRFHSHAIYEGFGDHIDKAVVELLLVPANVNAGKCVLVWWAFDYDGIQALKGAHQSQIQTARILDKHGINHDINTQAHKMAHHAATDIHKKGF